MNQGSERRNISRRHILKYGMGAIGAGSLTAWLGTGALTKQFDSSATAAELPQALAADPGAAKSRMTPDEALKKLMEGNQRFVSNKQQNPRQNMARLTEVAQVQAPFAAILSCADSRVVPEIAFDQGIGDLFVVRVAGNIAITEDIASEEFAVSVLESPLLMVLGHERCGAVDAAIKGGELPGVIDNLVYAIRPAIEATKGQSGDRLSNAVKANVLLQMKRLQTSPVISQLVEQGKLKVVGGYYDLDTGMVSLVS